MLDVQDLTVTYGGVTAVRRVSFSVPDGQIVALLGSNGAGKSTLLRAISKTVALRRGRIAGGRITFDGADLARENSARVVRRGVVQVPEARHVFTRMTVAENLRAGALASRSRHEREQARARVDELFPVLRERHDQRAGLLSGGEQQMLAIGRALMSAPRLLLLDEPSLGLAPRIIDQVADIIREINRGGTSVLLVEQNAAMALQLAEHAYVLEVGRISLSGPSAELRESDEVRRLYLGEAREDDVLSVATATTPRGLSRWVRP